MLTSVKIHIRVFEIFLTELRYICLKKLRIICNYRTVVMIVCFRLLKIIAHARVENKIDIFLQKIRNMTENKLCRITDRI